MKGSKPQGLIRTPGQRIRLDATGPELECRWCNEWWPITIDYWTLRRNGQFDVDRCRSCDQERNRLRYALLAIDPDYMENQRLRNRRYRYAIRKVRPDLLAAYDREFAQRQRDYQRLKRERRAVERAA